MILLGEKESLSKDMKNVSFDKQFQTAINFPSSTGMTVPRGKLDEFWKELQEYLLFRNLF